MQKYGFSRFIVFFFCFLVLSYSAAQNQAFNSLADEIQRKSNSRKTEVCMLLDSLYKLAYQDKDSDLCLARCLYEETAFNNYQGIVDTTLIDRIKSRLASPSLSTFTEGILLSAYGKNLYILGNFSEAFTIELQALEKFKQIDHSRFIAKSLNALGNICRSLSLLNLAEYYYSEAFALLTPEFYDYYAVKMNCNTTLGWNDFKAGLDSIFLLIETAEKINLVEILPQLYNNAAAICMRSDHTCDWDKAPLYFDKMQKLNIDNPKMNATLYCNMGEYYRMKEDLPHALTYFRKSQKLFEAYNDYENLMYVYHGLFETFEEQHQLDSALFYLQQSYDFAQELHNNMIAIETHQKYITTIVDVQHKDLTIATQKIELRNRLFFILAILLFSAVLLLLLFNQQRRRKASENRELSARLEHEKNVHIYEKRQRKLEKEKQEAIVDSKTREIASYSLLVANKNNLLKQIMELNAQMFTNKDNAVEIAAKVDKIIKSNFNMEEEWENFKMHFEKVHPHFFEKLKQQSPDLTEENLRMCAYYKIGMTTKQIAQLLNVIPNSIIMNRYRMKKKLHLSDEEDLRNFIRGL